MRMSIVEIVVALIAGVTLWGSGLFLGLVIARSCIAEREERQEDEKGGSLFPVPAEWWVR